MDATRLERPITPTLPEGTGRLRAMGAAIAIALAGIPTGIGLLDPDARVTLAIGGAVGIAVGAVIGWRQAPAVRSMSAGQAFDRSLRLGLASVALGALLVATALAIPSLGSADDLGGLFLGVAFWVLVLAIGLVLFGLPAFALAFVVIWPWTFVIRHLPRWLAGSERTTRPPGHAG